MPNKIQEHCIRELHGFVWLQCGSWPSTAKYNLCVGSIDFILIFCADLHTLQNNRNLTLEGLMCNTFEVRSIYLWYQETPTLFFIFKLAAVLWIDHNIAHILLYWCSFNCTVYSCNHCLVSVYCWLQKLVNLVTVPWLTLHLPGNSVLPLAGSVNYSPI